jgi:hypothetical protein
MFMHTICKADLAVWNTDKRWSRVTSRKHEMCSGFEGGETMLHKVILGYTFG